MCIRDRREICDDLGVPCALTEVFAKGGQGGLALARAVLSVLQPGAQVNFAYPDDAPLKAKVEEMCIRDRPDPGRHGRRQHRKAEHPAPAGALFCFAGRLDRKSVV